MLSVTPLSNSFKPYSTATGQSQAGSGQQQQNQQQQQQQQSQMQSQNGMGGYNAYNMQNMYGLHGYISQQQQLLTLDPQHGYSTTSETSTTPPRSDEKGMPFYQSLFYKIYINTILI